MIVVKKKKLGRPLKLAVTAGVLAVLIVAAIIINTLIAVDDGGGTGNTEPPEIIEGLESIHNGAAVVYPSIAEKNVIRKNTPLSKT